MSVAAITIRAPCSGDGLAISELISACPPLDPNSTYAYQLLVHHFSSTCRVAVAENDEIVGVVTGYRLPADPRVLFVWQVAVAEAGRGQGLAGRLLDALVEANADITAINTTISPDNVASERSFAKLTERLGGQMRRESFLTGDSCGPGHDPEDLIIIDQLTLLKAEPEKQA